MKKHYRELAVAQGAGRFFSVWEKLATTQLAEVKTEKGEEGFTVACPGFHLFPAGILLICSAAEVKTEKGEEGFTVFTVSDETLLENIPQGNGNNLANLLDITKELVVDPLEVDPVLQRHVVATQLVLGPLDLTTPSTTKTVGGRTIIIKIREDG